MKKKITIPPHRHIPFVKAFALFIAICAYVAVNRIIPSRASTISTVVPPGATMDMFDYYVMGKDIDQNYEGYAHPEIATNGINAGRQLKFLYNNPVRNWSYDATTAKYMKSVVNDYVSNYDSCHDYTVNSMGYGNPKVDSGGYPHVVDSGHIDSSIDYLFDGSSQNGKISYRNVQPNIFKKNADEMYSYNSYNNFAQFHTSTKKFSLEDKAGDGFFPYDNISTSDMKCNHYFGMHLTQPFYIPANLKTESGKELVFNFSGDDDVYIDIDGAVISLNIFLSLHNCTINFTTGQISTDTGGFKANYTIKDLFTRAGITPKNGFSGDTLSGNTYHTLNFYYLERGNWGSNCIINYNIQTKPITVSYDGNGSASGDNKNISSHVDESLVISNNWFSKTGYDFKEWNTKADGSGTSYSGGASTSFGSDVTLYAIWVPRTYTIVFNPNATDIEGTMSSIPMTYGQTKNLTKNAYKRIGYKFVGWKMNNASTGTSYSDGASVSNLTTTNKSTVTMYAQWKEISYTIRFDKNRTDAIGTMQDLPMKYDEEKTLTRFSYSSVSGTFAGTWNTNPDGSGTAYEDGQKVINLTGDNGTVITLYAQWATNTYDVTFIDDHDGTTLKVENVEYGNDATPPDKPKHTGYTALDWDDGYKNVTESKVLRLEYRPNSYTIAFDSNGGTGDMPNQAMKYDTKSALNDNKFTRDGYTYCGWRLEDKDTGTGYANGEEVENLTDVDGITLTMYAQWSTNGYEISFDKNAEDATGSMSNIHMNYDETRNLTKNSFTRTGYIFTGWRISDASSGIEYKDEASVSNLTSMNNKTITMYAQWTPIAYTIKFDKNKNDASGLTESMSMRYDEAKELTANGFSSPSAKWCGWNISKDGTGFSYSNKQRVKNLTSDDGGVITLYAQWSTNTYTVRFIDGRNGDVITSANVNYGSDATPPTKPHHNGYTATTWNGDYRNVTEDRIITLQYRPNSYRIAFDANGGSGTIPNQHLEYDTAASLNKNLFTRTGYSFVGWKLGNKTSGADYVDGQEIKNLTDVDEDVITMYAQWAPHGYSIRYDANGGTGSMPDQAMTYDVPSKLSANAFKRDGYSWAGWRRDDSINGAQYRNRQEVKNLVSDDSSTTTMYAQWTRNSYTVTFIDGFDNSTIGTIGVEYGDSAKAPTAPSHTGYTPTGWDSDFSRIAGDTTVTMRYRANRYRIAFDKNAANAMGDTPIVDAEYDKTTILTANGFSRDGYDWLYWTENANGSGRQYSDRQSVINLTDKDGTTVTLYAQWKIKKHSVTFIDGMTGDVISRTEVEHGSKAQVPSIPNHTGYKPSEWDKPFDNVTGDITATIKYNPISYKIKFDKNSDDATGTMDDMSIKYDQEKVLTRNAFTRPGYRFIGWGRESNGDVAFSDGDTVRNLASEDEATITLYAQWVEKDSVHITYKTSPDDGGTVSNTGDTLNPETGIANGSTATASTGYKFIGWYDGDAEVTNNETLTLEKPSNGPWIDATYIAKFEKIKCRVSFVGKNGEKLKDDDVEYGDAATAPDAPHVDGYEFIGWDKPFDNVTEDITVRAIYKEIPVGQPAKDDEPKAEEPLTIESAAVNEAQPELEQTGIEVNGSTIASLFIGVASAIVAAAMAVRRR